MSAKYVCYRGVAGYADLVVLQFAGAGIILANGAAKNSTIDCSSGYFNPIIGYLAGIGVDGRIDPAINMPADIMGYFYLIVGYVPASGGAAAGDISAYSTRSRGYLNIIVYGTAIG
ncbi:MAG: hypothetical protein LBU64_04945 [Planctomycetota bacterium]|nr:hypothetical protein [Planctomycetota bacterium]